MIKIAGKTYSEEDITSAQNQPGVQGELVDFLKNWLDDAQTINLQTSGSTGIPKQIIARKEYLLNSAKATCAFFQLQPNDKALLCLPVKFIAGKMMILRSLAGRLDIYPTEVSSNPLKALETKVDFVAMTPQQVHTVLSETPNQFSLVQKLIVGGAPISQHLIEKLKQTGVNAWATFGMTETYSHVALKSISPVEKNEFTCLPGITVSVSPRNRLIIHAPKLGLADLTTHDIVELIDNTRFVWKGRSDFVINSGGIKLHPEELESKLATVLTAPFFITSIPDEKLGQKAVLVVQSSDLDLKSKIESWLPMLFTSVERPKAIYFLNQFVYTESGKIDRIKTKASIHD